MTREQVKALAIEMAAAMPSPPPQRMEIVATGEIRTEAAMTLARTFDSATHFQREALLAVARSFAP